MTVYLTILFFPFLMILVDGKTSINKKFFFYFILFLILFVGLRYSIGGDWNSYFNQFNKFKYIGQPPHDQIILLNNTFSLLSFLLTKLKLDFYSLNLILSFFCLISFYKYFSEKKYYWHATLISLPYLIFVVYMGYISQSIAIGFFLLFLKDLQNNHHLTLKQIIYFIAGCFSHYSLLLFAPLFLINFKFLKNKKLFILLLTICLGFIFLFMINDILEKLFIYIYNYDKVSHGAVFRMANNIPFIIAISFLAFRKILSFKEKFILYLYSFFSLLLILTLIIFPNLSTLLDRLNIYLIIFQPITIILVTNFIKKNYSKIYYFSYSFFLYLYSTSFFLLWVNFGYFSEYWLPYNNIINQLLFYPKVVF